MSGILRDIYIASTLEDLNTKTIYKEGGRSLRTHITFAAKAFSAAEDARKIHDEERAYVLYMKYLDIFSKVKKMPEYKKDPKHFMTLIGAKNVSKALDQAELLSTSLDKRYKQLKKDKEAKESVETKEDVPDHITNGVIPEDFVFPKDQVDCSELYEILFKKRKSVLLFDIRSTDDFNTSHIKHELCINVPNNFIKPGSVPAKVQKGITADHLSIWNSRDSTDLVVLLDWDSSLKRMSNLSDPLKSLCDCINKWDQEKCLKRPPVVLEGGYAEWIGSYPQFTTNPQAKPPTKMVVTNNVNSLLDFNYNDLLPKLTPQPIEQKTPDIQEMTTQSKTVNNNASVPSSKPSDPILPSSINSPSETSINEGLYPSLSMVNHKITSIPKPAEVKQPNVASQLAAKKQQPKFDRSVKPSFANKSPVTAPKSPEVSVQPIPKQQPVVANHAPPKPKSKSPPILDHSGAISEIEKEMAAMKEKASVTQRDLANIEQQRKMAEMRAQLDEMKRNEAEMERKKKEAQRGLAVAMRGFSKPGTDKSTPSVLPVEKDAVSSNKQTTEIETTSSPTIPPNESKPTIAKPTDPINADNKAPYKSDLGKTVGSPVDLIAAQKPVENPVSTTSLSNLQPVVKPTLPKEDSKPATLSQPKAEPPPQPPKPYPAVNQNTTAKIPPTSSQPKQQPTTLHEVKPVDKKAKPARASISSPSISSNPALIKPEPPKQERGTSFKSEGAAKKSGLKRSSSSPNIAKMVQDDRDRPSKAPIPAMPSRSSKPQDGTFSIEPSSFESQLDRSLQGVYGGGDKALCGLRNLGNTCYMNSTLQCMFSTTQLARYVLQYSYRSDINRNNKIGSGGKVAEAFTVLLRAAWNGQYKYIIPRDFKYIVGQIKPMFMNSTQEDAQEFLMCLLDELHEDLNRKSQAKYAEEPDNDHLSDEEASKQAWAFHKRRNESIVVELFSGQFKATVQCLTCRSYSRKFDTFMYLSLPLPQSSTNIYDVIKAFGKTEKMSGSDKWYCPKCKTHRDAARNIVIWKLPPVLIVHFKRFVHTGRWLDKIHTNISYPITGLDLRPYIYGPQKRQPYDLYAVAHHQGPGLDSGHYTATCKNTANNQWYKFDDTEVYRASFPPEGPTSFILFYSCYPRTI